MLLRGAGNRSLGAGLVAESSAYSVLQAGPEFARWLGGTDRGENAARDRAAAACCIETAIDSSSH